MIEELPARFAELVAVPEHELPLDVGALMVGAVARPDLDVESGLALLDELARGVEEPTLDGLIRHLFGAVGLRGDTDSYYDPRNSVLTEVIDRRRGIPITLAVVLIEVGRRVGVPLAGVGMPGHFLVRGQDGELLDPFAGGARLDLEDARRRFEALHPGARFSPAHLAPAGPRAVLARMLGNLAVAFRRGGDRAGLCRALELRMALPGASERDRRELAVLLGAAGRFSDGAAVLEAIGSEADRRAAVRLRARLN